jgi:hypothetical protein
MRDRRGSLTSKRKKIALGENRTPGGSSHMTRQMATTQVTTTPLMLVVVSHITKVWFLKLWRRSCPKGKGWVQYKINHHLWSMDCNLREGI